ncbi:hypothetical protein Poli38472_005231 [Pythium oligandrum]|uniref:Uncharacterized protein n=1 Tax=Pythium oligandrum TaxID=41045 RepID=A0A8K1CGK5_PYTOL|nr:hypothetical protein Poli38472_005231 [Pythium oligandrum]|eukprot:TMW62613.1 hypothetical protein Poli38472_005231 [Pythium oligandrum]
MLPDALRNVLIRLGSLWTTVQVEHHGRYSVERLYYMNSYIERTSWWRVLAVHFSSIVPCLVLNTLIESIPLRPITEGVGASHTFWARATIVVHIMAFTALEQYRLLIPSLPSSRWQIVKMTVIMGTGSVIGEYALARWIGYPVPFLLITASPPYVILMAGCVAVAWGKYLKQNPKVMLELKSYQNVISVVFLLVFMYPAYNYLFVRLTPTQQTWFTLLLPVIKLIAKNAISPFCKYIEDFKPEAVIFNVEIFHAFFVAMCMQTATSYRTTALLMLMDFVHACLSLWDIVDIVNHIQHLSAKLIARKEAEGQSAAQSHSLSDLCDHVLGLVKADPSLQDIGNIRITSRLATKNPPTVFLVAQANSVVPMAPNIPPRKPVDRSRRRSTFDVTKIPDPLTAAEQHTLMQSLDVQDRAAYVASVLKLLHLVEFVVLVEFTEVIIPFIYCIYLYVTYYLPNGVFHMQLRGLDEAELHRTLGNVLLYAGLELLSLLILQILIYRKIQLSPAHQLAFVLEKQWTLVQLKLNVWFLFMIQLSVDHFGMDYSFQFAWLKGFRV